LEFAAQIIAIGYRSKVTVTVVLEAGSRTSGRGFEFPEIKQRPNSNPTCGEHPIPPTRIKDTHMTIIYIH